VVAAVKMSHDAIRSYAERIGEYHDIYDDLGLADVTSLVKKLGGQIEYDDGGEALHVYGPGDFVIHLPRVTSARRDRFTLAHELGHYFLHYRVPKLDGPESFGRGDRNLLETQANVFASSILMPEEDFTRAWREESSDAWAVSRRFEVSPAAADVRAQVLGLR
jgi:Zn-dependent peptidase ImmA (M78 family)